MTAARSSLSIAAIIALFGMARTSAFSLSMAQYQPPIKSVVGKLRDPRLEASKTRSSSREAYAGAMAPPSTPSFEQRMRDMVLGTQQTLKKRAPVTAGPANLITIDNLKDYKRVVGDETEKMVAVRFYAPWCRVSVEMCAARLVSLCC
jgi:hypothetical protein